MLNSHYNQVNNFRKKRYKRKELLLPLDDSATIDCYCKSLNVSFNDWVYNLIAKEMEKNGIELNGKLSERQVDQ